MSETTAPPQAIAKLARMANQIAHAFSAQPHAEAIAGVADHIAKFWTPKMRRDLASHLNTGDVVVDAIAREAFEFLKGP